MAVCLENQGSEFARAVSPSLKKGISALNALTISLLNVDRAFVAKSDSSFSEIRRAVISVQQNLGEAEKAALSKLKAVDKCYEELIVRKQNLSIQQDYTKGALRDLKQQQKNNNATLEMYKKSACDAVSQLKEAKAYLWHQQRAVEEAEELRDAGIGITFIPILGWIAGPIMIAAAENDIENANYRVQEAERMVNSFRSSVHEYERKVSEYTSRIQEACKEIVKRQDSLREIERDIQQVLRQRREMAGFQENMRNSVRVLSVLAGTSNVAEIQTRCFVLIEAMIKLMQTFGKLVEATGENRLICDDGIKALITKLQVNYVKMQAIIVPSDTAAIDFI
ncbi:uncharacterized protein LOC103031583 [Astyanax mexicanus]|uniref:uncharacterized protein LOC103031583 n=1 Tax=Astyanax mexicanus TaxID=7994 RepID=UPI000BBDEA29|nr:uncharacterized protein LOC103031583 [Astyanax mexicanus]